MLVPGHEHRPPVVGHLLGRDVLGVAQPEVEGCAGRRPLSVGRLEPVQVTLPTVVADGPGARLALRRGSGREVGEVDERGVPAEAVAAGLAGEQVVQVAAHRLVLLEPALRNHVLTVERELRLDLRLQAGGVALLQAFDPDHSGRALLQYDEVCLDELFGFEDLGGVEALQLAVGLEVDPGIELQGRLVPGGLPVGGADQLTELPGADVSVVRPGGSPVSVGVVVGPVLRVRGLRESGPEVPRHHVRHRGDHLVPVAHALGLSWRDHPVNPGTVSRVNTSSGRR